MDAKVFSRSSWLVAASAVLTAWVLPAPAAAQTIPAHAILPGSSGSHLTLQGSVNGGYDVNAIPSGATSIGLNSPLFQGSAANIGADLQLSYSQPAGRRATFGANAGSSFRAYRGSDFVPVSHFGSAGVSIGVTPHLLVQGAVDANYSPRYQFDLFPQLAAGSLGQAAPQPLDYSLSFHQALEYGIAGGLSYAPTKRSTFELGYNYRNLLTDPQALFRGKTTQSSAIYHLALRKSFGIRAGYRYQLSEYIDGASGATVPVRTDNIELGLDYGLSRGVVSPRRTMTFGFGTGAFNDAHNTRFMVVGRANLTQQLYRSWSLTAAYDRGVHFVEGFGVPLFSDSVSARIGGQLTRRVAANGTFAYSFGGNDDVSSTAKYHTYRSVAGLYWPLTRRLQAFAEYFSYHHGFSESLFLVIGAPPDLNRQGVRAGVGFSVPLRR